MSNPLPQPTPAQLALLGSILSQEEQKLQAFAQLLDEELVALQRGVAEDIETIVGRKNKVAEELQAFERQKLKIVATAFPNREEELKKILMVWLADPPLLEIWQRVCALAKECRLRNQRNGTVVRELQLFTQRALSLLLETDAQLTTYDELGRNRLLVTGSGRQIGSA
ncbi:MAG: flagellar protein FlgN [Hydrogenophilus sp.]|nr:flagellar protein FlgN [Hydrogenophilus sp.]